MARVSSAPEGGKFRARAAAALDGQAGLWGGVQGAGQDNLLCVELDANGELVLATGPDCAGVIDVTEGRTSKAVDLANFRQVIGGKRYTVLQRAHVQEMAGSEDSGTTVLGAGDRLYADSGADGDVRIGAAGGVGDSFIGYIVPDDTVRGGGGLVLILEVNGAAAGTA